MGGLGCGGDTADAGDTAAAGADAAGGSTAAQVTCFTKQRTERRRVATAISGRMPGSCRIRRHVNWNMCRPMAGRLG